MLIDGASADASKRRFIRRVSASQTVFHLCSNEGVANAISNTDEGSVVLMFWSDAAYARRVQANGFDSYEIETIDLFDFLFRWLPGMTGDGVLAGLNWDHELRGRECDPFELREEIEEAMSDDLMAEYQQKYEELTRDA